MKKLLVVLLALALVFGLATTAFAYSDTSSLGTASQDAIAKLSALDIVGGYPDGTYGPAANITRAEFAKIAVNLAGLGDAADSLGDVSSRFSDVEAGAWYAGWVNLANAQGYVQGYPDGTFKPNANISMQEVVTVLLRIAGYDDNLVGPWPVDYIAKASALGVTDDVSFTATAKATRESVAVMSSNTLDQDVMYWDADKARFLAVNTPATTLLDESFNATIAADAVLGAWNVEDFDDMTVQLAVNGANKTFADSYYITDGKFVNGLANMIGDVYYNDDGDIIFIDVTSTTANSDDVDITYAVAGTTPTVVKVDDDAQSLSTTAAGVINCVVPADVIGTNNYIATKLYYNEDGELYLVQDKSGASTNAVVIDEYNASSKRIDALYGSSLSVKDKDVVVIKNGAFASLEDLKSGDVYFRSAGTNGVDEVISVSSMKEGELTAGSATKLTIADKKLTYATAQYTDDEFDSTAAVTLAALDDAFGTTVKYVTANGNPYDLAVMSIGASEDTSTIYGVITGADGNISGKVTALTILNQDGEEVTYDLVDGDTTALPVWGFGAGKIEAGSYIEAKVSADGTIDTDNITAMTNTTALASGPMAGDYSALNGTGKYVGAKATAVTVVDDRILLAGKYYTVTDDTAAFDVALVGVAGTAFDEADVVAPADITDASNIANADYVAKVVDGEVVSIVFLSSTLTSSSNYGVLTDSTYKSGDWYVTVGDTEYEAAADYTALNDDTFCKYTLTDSKVSAPAAVLAQTATDAYTILADGAAFPDGNVWVDLDGTADVDALAPTCPITLISKSGNNLSLGSDAAGDKNYVVNSDTKYYEIEADGDIVEADLGAFAAGDKVFAITTDDLTDWTVAYLFLVDAATDLSASSTTLAAATLATDASTTTFTVTAPTGATIAVTSSDATIATVGLVGTTGTITNVTAAAGPPAVGGPGAVTVTVTISKTGCETITYTAIITCTV